MNGIRPLECNTLMRSNPGYLVEDPFIGDSATNRDFRFLKYRSAPAPRVTQRISEGRL
jgi:hypothetical protein